MRLFTESKRQVFKIIQLDIMLSCAIIEQPSSTATPESKKMKFTNIMGRDVYSCQVIRDKEVVLNTFTHYSSPEAKRDRTIFGKEESGLFYNYSDRLWQWDYDKCEKANSYARLVANPNTAKYFEAMLSYFHDGAKVSLRHILAGCNRSNGSDYLIYGYKYTAKPEDADRLLEYNKFLGE